MSGAGSPTAARRQWPKEKFIQPVLRLLQYNTGVVSENAYYIYMYISISYREQSAFLAVLDIQLYVHTLYKVDLRYEGVSRL